MYQSLECVIATVLLCLIVLLTNPTCGDDVYHDYCVVGAGPAGLQMGYFLQSADRDYIVFERSNTSGNFFVLYPRHRKLISINKRHTGQKNPEFNLRHDWNSLLSDDDDLKMTRYSDELFPSADVLLRYLDDYQKKLKIKVQFNTNISNIHKELSDTAPDGHLFKMRDQRGQQYTCRTLIVATGIATPNIPKMKGIELADGYEDVSIDPKDYEGKSVLILGRGNAAFEVADGIYGATNVVHMIARSRVRLAWATHYVGDLRAVNNNLLDTYQLKSLDGVFETPVSQLSLVQSEGKISCVPADDEFLLFDNSATRHPYDVVIRALGFTFDSTIFNNTDIVRGKSRAKKYPAIKYNYESLSDRGLFYAGTNSHSLDFRKSAGGFIHGFRYTARALHRLLEWRYEGVPWPSASLSRTDLLNTIIRRINEASGIYQMFQVLGDVALFSENGKTLHYMEDFPINLIHQLPRHTGLNGTSVLVLVMEYGPEFSGPGKDIFRRDRSTLEPSDGHTSNFLHPVFYYYKSLPTDAMMKSRRKQDTLPRPDMLHHIVEDFLTKWDARVSHILPLRRFLENIWNTDMRNFYSQACFHMAMTHGSVPEKCEEGYLSGHGLYGTEDQFQAAMMNGLLLNYQSLPPAM